MKILSIDVGIIHLALVYAILRPDYLSRLETIIEEEIVFCDLIDITQLIYCNDKDCELYHDKIICDYMLHLFKKYRKIFDESDIILIERQPITGLVAVQELILREYRSKSKLISPNAMLNYMGILNIPYEDRKKYTEKFAMNCLGSLKVFIFNQRRHDMADAFCILYYFISLKREDYKNNEKEKEHRFNNKKFIKNMELYLYKPN